MTAQTYPQHVQFSAAELLRVLNGGASVLDVEGIMVSMPGADVPLKDGMLKMFRTLAENEPNQALSDYVTALCDLTEKGLDALENVSKDHKISYPDVEAIWALWDGIKDCMEVFAAYALHAKQYLDITLLRSQFSRKGWEELIEEIGLDDGHGIIVNGDAERVSLAEALMKILDPTGSATREDILDLDIPKDNPHYPFMRALRLIDYFEYYTDSPHVESVQASLIEGNTGISPKDIARHLGTVGACEYLPQITHAFMQLSQNHPEFQKVLNMTGAEAHNNPTPEDQQAMAQALVKGGYKNCSLERLAGLQRDARNSSSLG